jgi:hypothetical protein
MVGKRACWIAQADHSSLIATSIVSLDVVFAIFTASRKLLACRQPGPTLR